MVNVVDGKYFKLVASPNYNYVFNKKTGYFMRWGVTQDDDPVMAPMPEILDVEISEICSIGCEWCYKSNLKDGRNMTLDTFTQILSLFTPFVTQVALGIGDAHTNPDLVDIMLHCRKVGVVPNLTLTGRGLHFNLAENVAELAGAISVSVYPHTKELAYNTLRHLQSTGRIEQVNFHLMIANELLDFTYEVLNDIINSNILNPSAVVLLALKQKGRGKDLTSLSKDQFKELVDFCFEHDIPLGFDSCSASAFQNIVGEGSKFDEYIEPCESGLFSYYVNVNGVGFPCSFTEDEWEGVNLLNVKDFKEVWNGDSLNLWRDCLLCNNRECPVYNIYGGK